MYEALVGINLHLVTFVLLFLFVVGLMLYGELGCFSKVKWKPVCKALSIDTVAHLQFRKSSQT